MAVKIRKTRKKISVHEIRNDFGNLSEDYLTFMQRLRDHPGRTFSRVSYPDIGHRIVTNRGELKKINLVHTSGLEEFEHSVGELFKALETLPSGSKSQVVKSLREFFSVHSKKHAGFVDNMSKINETHSALTPFLRTPLVSHLTDLRETLAPLARMVPLTSAEEKTLKHKGLTRSGLHDHIVIVRNGLEEFSEPLTHVFMMRILKEAGKLKEETRDPEEPEVM